VSATPYSDVDDLLIGATALPKGMEPQKYVDDAANEIDSKIGFIYVTPVDISETSTTKRPVRLLLKRLNNHLATGRLITALSSNSQRTDLQPYGASLIREVLAVLDRIESGDLILAGAELVAPEGDEELPTSGPLIFNVDAESNVEAFYDRIANPYYCYTPWELHTPNSSGLVA
jgi:hypothetical protein